MPPHATIAPHVQRLQRQAGLVGLVCAGLCVVGYFLYPAQFFRSYLMAYMFWLGVVLGCLAILMVHHLVGGLWGMVIRRGLEASTRLLPLMLLLFVPLLFGISELYPWARPGGLEGHGADQFRRLYLRLPFFWGRAGVYFVVWLLLVFFLNRWSRQQEQTPDPLVIRSRQRRLGLLSGVGLALYGLSMTFAAVDWMMSLEPSWFSTIYGFLVMTGQLLVAMAFAIVVTSWLAKEAPFAAVTPPMVFHDLGNLLLAFVLLWAYNAFSQLLIIWSGDLPEENSWYLHRASGGWNWVGVFLLVLHFAVPFCMLLSRQTKRRAQVLTVVAAVVFCTHLVEVFWLVMPAFFPGHLRVHWLDIVAPLAIGGLWLAAFLWQLPRRSLLPWHEPRLQEVLQHG
jgi:hypothetical protein